MRNKERAYFVNILSPAQILTQKIMLDRKQAKYIRRWTRSLHPRVINSDCIVVNQPTHLFLFMLISY